MKHVISPLVTLLFVVGCGASHAHDDATPTSDVILPCVAPGAPNAETCGYVVRGCCYATAALACHVAGCSEESCTIVESFPAQVSCR